MELNLLKLLSEFGYAGMFFLIFSENVFPPIPSEAILSFGGFLTEYTDLKIQGLFFAATAGATAGAMILYGAGRLMSFDRIEHIWSERRTKTSRLQGEDIRKTFDWFDKHKKKAVLIGRCIPVIRSLISIPAGMDKMPVYQFLIYTAIGSGVWNCALLYLGKAAGKSWYKISHLAEQYTAMIVTMVLAVSLLILACKLSTIKKKD